MVSREIVFYFLLPYRLPTTFALNLKEKNPKQGVILWQSIYVLKCMRLHPFLKHFRGPSMLLDNPRLACGINARTPTSFHFNRVDRYAFRDENTRKWCTIDTQGK